MNAIALQLPTQRYLAAFRVNVNELVNKIGRLVGIYFVMTLRAELIDGRIKYYCARRRALIDSY